MHAAVARECLAVRTSCGIFDASTLGKIEVVGHDAVTFMNRMYVNAWTSLAVGRCRYGSCCATTASSTTTAWSRASARIASTSRPPPAVHRGCLAMMEDYLQTEWPDLSVWLTSTTEQWAVIAVQGPNSRANCWQQLVDVDISAAAMPHMSVARGQDLRRPDAAVPRELHRRTRL